MALRKILKSYFKNLWMVLFYGASALFYLSLTKEFWRHFFRILFVEFFWQVLATTILFILMIPAVLSGDIPLWSAIIGSLAMGILSQYLSNTYDNFNPLRGKFGKKR